MQLYIVKEDFGLTIRVYHTGDYMRTSYPTPSNSFNYKYKLVDSTFIHAVHYRETNNYTCEVGVSFLKDTNSVTWYAVTNASTLYKNLTDEHQSPGFEFNRRLRGKKSVTLPVVDEVEVDYREKFHESMAKAKAADRVKTLLNTPRLDGGKLQSVSFGPILDTSDCSFSNVIGYLGLGFERNTKGFVVYYSFKGKPQDLYAFVTDDASVFRNWSNADSKGRYYNEAIRGTYEGILVRKAATETLLGASK